MREKEFPVRIILIISCCTSLVCFLASCSAPKKIVVVPTVEKTVKIIEFDPATYFDVSALRLYNMVSRYPNSLQKRMRSSSLDSLQIKLTSVTKSTNNTNQFQEDLFQPLSNSIIEAGMMGKIFLALACVKKMQDYRLKGIDYTTTMIVEAAGENLPGAYNDPYSAEGKPSIGQYLARMLMHNDVEAYNRIFELVTKDQINSFLKLNSWNATYLNGRIGRTFTAKENATMNLINFYDDNNRKLFTQPNTISSIITERKGRTNVTSVDDIQSILLSLFSSNKQTKELAMQIGEEQLEYIKVLLLNSQNPLSQNAGDYLDDNVSLLFPNVRTQQKLLIVPLKSISAKGMSETALYTDLTSGKIFVLTCSILFKSYTGTKGFEKELNDGRQFFEELGNSVLSKS